MLLIVLRILTALSMGYLLCAWCSAKRFFARPTPADGRYRPFVSILKPVRGVDDGTYDNFASFCRQDYPRYELLFGVSDLSDPAVAVVGQLQRAFPTRTVRLVFVDARGANPKSAILAGLTGRSKGEVLAISDSDIRVGPDYLSNVVAPLTVPDVGAVTCLYRNGSGGNLVGQLAALYLATDFLPSAILANRSLGIGFCLGATIVLRRADLARLGGYASMADHLADDYQIGAKVKAAGRRVWLSDYVVTTFAAKPRFREQWRRELRWARGIRVNLPLQYPGILLTQPTVLAAATVVASGFAAWAAALLTAAVGLRWLVAREMTRCLDVRVSTLSLMCLPLRDAWSSAVWAAGLVGRRIVWRDRVYLLLSDGRLKV